MRRRSHHDSPRPRVQYWHRGRKQLGEPRPPARSKALSQASHTRARACPAARVLQRIPTVRGMRQGIAVLADRGSSQEIPYFSGLDRGCISSIIRRAFAVARAAVPRAGTWLGAAPRSRRPFEIWWGLSQGSIRRNLTRLLAQPPAPEQQQAQHGMARTSPTLWPQSPWHQRNTPLR
jgi:hypothetical protein